MAKKYENGSKGAAIRLMAMYAIRDQQSLIAALTPDYRAPDEDTAQAIEDAEKCIRDFKRIAEAMSDL